jgi:formamidopyrimidine-DNA glycosylase
VPELPEVEIYRRDFDRSALGKEIASVAVTDQRVLHRTTFPALRRSLEGRRFHRTHRHGKHFFADAGEAWLYLHFGMSGGLTAAGPGRETPRFTRLLVRFADGSFLAFEDMRLFGRVGLVTEPGAFVQQQRLGPDPLEPSFTRGRFLELLAKRRGAVKSFLMDQRNIAGLGNLWVDELLYQTSIHPRRGLEKVPPAARSSMFKAMRRLLLAAIDRQERDVAYPPKWLIENREEGSRCARCGGTIARTVVFGRTTYYCKRHQR